MKNIHILPTDKPSRLFIIDGKLYNYHKPQQGDGVNEINQNIYITSDEEIKEGDWVLFISTNEVTKVPLGGFKGKVCKKIILTTDVDLIKDGVQPIDDEFLEWFVKNPSCKEVGVGKVISKEPWNPNIKLQSYKIIIPKEEPKQETLEEAADRLTYHDTLSWENTLAMESFKIGAKWQAERSFSKEEFRQIAEWSFHFYKRNDLSDSELEKEWEELLNKKLKTK